MPLNSIYMLPERTRTMAELQELLEAEQRELDILEGRIETEKAELYLHSAVDSLPRFERIYGIQTIPSDSIDVRRRRLLAKHNSRGVCTPETLKKSVYIITGNPSDVIEHFSKGSFTVIVHMPLKDSTAYLHDLISLIYEVRPAHLIFHIIADMESISFPNKQNIKLFSITFFARADSFEVNTINLDGRRRLDGSWTLAALTEKGLYLHMLEIMAKAHNKQSMISCIHYPYRIPNAFQSRFSKAHFSFETRNGQGAKLNNTAITARQKNRETTTATVTIDSMYRLDGSEMLYGSKRLNADIIKEVI